MLLGAGCGKSSLSILPHRVGGLLLCSQGASADVFDADEAPILNDRPGIEPEVAVVANVVDVDSGPLQHEALDVHAVFHLPGEEGAGQCLGLSAAQLPPTARTVEVGQELVVEPYGYSPPADPWPPAPSVRLRGRLLRRGYHTAPLRWGMCPPAPGREARQKLYLASFTVFMGPRLHAPPY